MPIGKDGRYTFRKQYSTWEVNQAWRAQRRAAIERFQAQSSLAVSGFTSAWTNQINGSAEITTQMTVNRLKAETAAKVEKTLSGIDVSV